MALDFSDKRTPETVNLTWDCTHLLVSGETISTAAITASVLSGTDANPQDIVSGSASIAGAKVTQTIVAGVDGVTYALICKITTSASQTLEIPARLKVTDTIT